MGGFFFDDLVVGIVHMVRRERRRSQTLRWSTANGTITRFTTSYGSPTLPLVDYTYQVSGQNYDGSATGSPIRDDQINEVGDLLDSLPSVCVRYDPANPEVSRILNEDNPPIPFEIDHLQH